MTTRLITTPADLVAADLWLQDLREAVWRMDRYGADLIVGDHLVMLVADCAIVCSTLDAVMRPPVSS